MPNRSADKLSDSFPIPVGKFYIRRGGRCCTAPFNSTCRASSRAGGTTGLFKYQACRLSLTEGRHPTSDSEGVSLQRLHRPALGQQQEGVPPLCSGGVGTRIIRRRKFFLPICNCSRDRSISLTLITDPSLLLRPAKPIPSQIYPMRLRISSWLWFKLRARYSKNELNCAFCRQSPTR